MATKVIAEIGINHNGSLDTALKLIDAAADAGADYVKFQKRTPRDCVPKDEWYRERDTPWGRISYIDYKERMEFSEIEYGIIRQRCADRGIFWFLSVWDQEALRFAMRTQDSGYIKIPSAKITDLELVEEAGRWADTVILSTGMSTQQEVFDAVKVARRCAGVVLMHCHSAYPAPTEELNLRMIPRMIEWYLEDCQIGYSGHEYGIAPTVWAVILGATWVERHITLDRTMWGTDQMASVEPRAFRTMVDHIRSAEAALGDGIKRVWDSELPAKAKLRGSL